MAQKLNSRHRSTGTFTNRSCDWGTLKSHQADIRTACLLALKRFEKVHTYHTEFAGKNLAKMKEAIAALNGQRLGGRPLTVNEATPEPSRDRDQGSSKGARGR